MFWRQKVKFKFYIENIPFDVVFIIFYPNKHLISKGNINNVLAPALANENFDLNENIVVAPNPTNDFVNIIVPSFVKIERISNYNTLGQKVTESTTGTVL
ncbi:hypothetical protein [Flavobacterium sp.]|uniref:hypothetical protein n=1 Tax=Flavobacterium sp. TaxID=239 RepID=UPI00286E6699|nr:hypothetical protein [Flavobacterium sp.]